MSPTSIKKRNFGPEFIFNASRSSGAGGQNVNKVNTKVELRFNIATSHLFNDEEKDILRQKLRNKINDENELILVSQTERSQLKNKKDVILKFHTLVEKALTPKKKRRPTRPTAASKTRRLGDKKMNSEKKTSRKVVED